MSESTFVYWLFPLVALLMSAISYYAVNFVLGLLLKVALKPISATVAFIAGIAGGVWLMSLLGMPIDLHFYLDVAKDALSKQVR